LSIQGYVPSSKRGSVSGVASGIESGFQAVIHWYNNASQYWATAGQGGAYQSPLMKPGTYTVKLYRGEFPVAQDTVTVTAGSNTTKNIASTEPKPSVIWRIGNFDGQPFELKNGDKIERMHPEDVRMGSWGGSYIVGKSSAKEFPMALFSKQGGTATVTFDLSEAQAAAETTLRVGTTLSFKGGRPSVKIGSWQGKDPGAPVRFTTPVIVWRAACSLRFTETH
jgi:rhamnogalacturonan endolyase